MEFEKLYQDLEIGAEIIQVLVNEVEQTDAMAKPNPDSWSVLEVMCHLYDIEREDFRKRLDSILHRPTENWTLFDTGSWVTKRNYNERNLVETLNGFLEERNKSLEWLKNLSEPDWEVEHTDQYGAIKAGDMLAAWVDHDNLHIRQLVELRHWRILAEVKPYGVDYAGEW